MAGLTMAVACSGHEIVKDGEYQAVAKVNYEYGMEEFRDENYLEARNFFQHVRNNYPYSMFAALSELRLADCDYEEGQFEMAITGYRDFVRFHPQHGEVANAMWRVSQAYVEQMPSDLFFLPPTFEKDLTATLNALQSLQAYVERFAEHEHAPEARKVISRCQDQLAARELYVAEFYQKRGKPKAAVDRLEHLVNDYPTAGVAERSYLRWVELCVAQSDRPCAEKALAGLVDRFPKSADAAAAVSMVRAMRHDGIH